MNAGNPCPTVTRSGSALSIRFGTSIAARALSFAPVLQYPLVQPYSLISFRSIPGTLLYSSDTFRLIPYRHSFAVPFDLRLSRLLALCGRRMPTRFLSTCCALLLSLGAVADTWPYSNFTTGLWHPPELHVTKTDTVDPGYIFIGPRGNYYAGIAPLIYDNDGNLVYQGPGEVTSNFRTQKLWGEDVLTFWAGDMTDLGFGFGTVHILDNTYKEIYIVRLQDNFLTPDGEPRESYIDLHESNITPRNTLLVSAYNITERDLTEIGGGPGQYMLDSQFYEVDIPTNKILYSWSALDHEEDIPLGKSSLVLGDSGTQKIPWDAYHINSIEPTEYGYLVSLRHYWSAYYVNYDGSIRWQLRVSTQDRYLLVYLIVSTG